MFEKNVLFWNCFKYKILSNEFENVTKIKSRTYMK